jgi:hypothetical protein
MMKEWWEIGVMRKKFSIPRVYVAAFFSAMSGEAGISN